MPILNITKLILENANRTAIKINKKLYLEINDVIEELQNYVKPFLHYVDEEWEISHSGTSFRINYKGKSFLILTKHQMERENEDDIDPKNIFMFLYDEIHQIFPIKNTIKSKFSQSDGKDERDDIIIFELHGAFPKDDEKIIHMNDYCLSLDEDQFYPITENDNNKKFMFTIGFPIEHTEYELDENKDGKTVLNSALNKYRLFSVSGPKSRLKMELNHRMFYDLEQSVNPIDLDGMSGSPIFSIFVLNGKRHLCFMGMITNESRIIPNRVAAYPAIIIKNILDDYIRKNKSEI